MPHSCFGTNIPANRTHTSIGAVVLLKCDGLSPTDVSIWNYRPTGADGKAASACICKQPAAPFGQATGNIKYVSALILDAPQWWPAAPVFEAVNTKHRV